MIYLRKVMMTLAACLATASFASAQDGAAMPFAEIARDPVSAGMGFSGIASGYNVGYSSFRNSSVIPFADERLSVGASGQIWAPNGVKSTNFAFGSAFRTGERFGFSVGGAYQIGEEYMSTDEMGNIAGAFKPNDLIINAGIGVRIIENLAAGVNVRYASQKLSADNSYSAFTTDIFLTYRLSELNISAGVSSLGTSVKSASGDSFGPPTSATVGVEWLKVFSAIHSLRLVVDADYYLSGDITAASGAEYSFKNFIFLRAGYHYGSKDKGLPSFASAGLGVKFAGVQLNAAYLLASETLGGSLMIGLGYSF